MAAAFLSVMMSCRAISAPIEAVNTKRKAYLFYRMTRLSSFHGDKLSRLCATIELSAVTLLVVSGVWQKAAAWRPFC